MDNPKLVKKNENLYEQYKIPLDSYRISSGISLIPREITGLVLDVGCANGDLSEFARQKGWNSIGLDISYVNARTTLEKNVPAIISTLNSNLPFKDESYEAVLAFEVIEHLVDTRNFLTECYRIIAKSGYLILTTPNLASLSNRLRLLFGKFPAWMDYELETGSGHVRYYSYSVLKNQAESIGFQFDKKTGTVLPIPILSRFKKIGFGNMDITRILGVLLPNFSSHLVVRFKK